MKGRGNTKFSAPYSLPIKNTGARCPLMYDHIYMTSFLRE